MTDIALHELTKHGVERFLSRPTHALLMIGPTGIGKCHLATHLAERLTGLTADQLDSYAYLRVVRADKDKSSIGIEAVRELQQFLKLKVPSGASQQPSWRIVIMDNAHTLTTEAQNALLKQLEEPPEQTIFLLAVAEPQALLPTIHSRSQQLTIQAPSQSALQDYFANAGYAQKDIQQAYLLSGGLPGLMHALLDDQAHPLKSAVQTARELLQATQFERLCRVDALAKDKAEAFNVMFILQHMARSATVQGAKVSDGSATKRIKQWHKVQRAAYQAEQAYAVSGQAKLTLTNLMLSL
jgi:DNA polymerase III, delta subunit